MLERTQRICDCILNLLLPFNWCAFVHFASELLKLTVFGLGMLTSWPHILATVEFCTWNTDSFVVVGAFVCHLFVAFFSFT